jgi:CRP-like cAMP-binding protein
MTDQILNNVKSIVKLSKIEEMALLQSLDYKQFKKNEIILQQGSICNSVMFINKGCIRYFYLKDGEEITGQFFSENNWFTDYDSYLTNKPSEIIIQALEDCTIVFIQKTKLEQLYEKHVVFERLGRLLAENAFIGLRSRYKSSMLLSPEDRYKAFLKNRPEIAQRVAQHYIASFLGIKPQSLSRIRKRIFSKK